MSIKQIWLAVFLIGLIVGLQFAPRAQSLTAQDVLPTVLALGVALPAGWLGFGAIRRR